MKILSGKNMNKFLILLLALCLFACSPNKTHETNQTEEINDMFPQFKDIPDLSKLNIQYRCGELIKLPKTAREEKDTALIKTYFDKDLNTNQLSFRKFYTLAKYFEPSGTNMLVWAEVFYGADDPVTHVKMAAYNCYGGMLNSIDITSDAGYLSSGACIEKSRYEIIAGKHEQENSIIYKQFVVIDGEENLLSEYTYGFTFDESTVIGLIGTYHDQEAHRKLSVKSGGLVIEKDGIGDFKLGSPFKESEMDKKYDFYYAEATGEYMVSLPDIKKTYYEIKTVDKIIKQIRLNELIIKTKEGYGIGDKVDYLISKLKTKNVVYIPENKEIFIEVNEYPHTWFVTNLNPKNKINYETNEVDPSSFTFDQVIHSVIIYDEN